MFSLLRKTYRAVLGEITDARAATELSRLSLPYAPWSASAMRPSAVATIVNDVIANRRRSAVEFGAGISTLFIARTIAANGGRIVSFDDDPDWTDIVNELLAEAGLADVGRVIHAPLGYCGHSLEGLLWYDSDTVARVIEGHSFDLMLADGPKAYEAGKGLARYPAYPVVRELMAERSVCILDDIERPGEREVIQRWESLAGENSYMRRTSFGIGMLYKGPAFTVAL
jgi:predicted O-methyltransferase YrrM